MKLVSLTLGFFTTVDDEDYNKVINLHPYASVQEKRVYAKVKNVPLTNILKGQPPINFLWDHKDRNTLNNQKNNLRLADTSQNGLNCRNRENTFSQYRGVYYDGRRGKWGAYVRLKGKRYSLGYYENIHDAAKAYNKKATELHGEFVVLNIIPENAT